MYMLFISYKERRQLSELSRIIYERVSQAVESRKATLYIPIHWELTDYARKYLQHSGMIIERVPHIIHHKGIRAEVWKEAIVFR